MQQIKLISPLYSIPPDNKTLLEGHKPDWNSSRDEITQFINKGGNEIMATEDNPVYLLATDFDVLWIIKDDGRQFHLFINENGSYIWQAALVKYKPQPPEERFLKYDKQETVVNTCPLELKKISDFIAKFPEHSGLIKETIWIWEDIKQNLFKDRCQVCDKSLELQDKVLYQLTDFIICCEAHRQFASVFQIDMIRKALGIPDRTFITKEKVMGLAT